jgi:oligopeptide/dipeptide ABC transporter ATP-binding protein
MPAQNTALLEVEDLCIGFSDDQGITAITEDVSFSVQPGEMYGLVGESGCGKSVTCLALLRLLPQPGGRVLKGAVRFKGRDLLGLPHEELRRLRGAAIAMIFQEPGAALNPLLTVRHQLLEPLKVHGYVGKAENRIRELLERVGIADVERVLRSYPHALSGGMLQRVMIAMALALKPALLLADEPTTALDVTVQAQIMDLLDDLRRDLGMAVILVTHNLNLIAQYADRVGVMYAGRLVEEAEVGTFLQGPRHPYSQGLLNALPRLSDVTPRLRAIPGTVPKPSEYDLGCRFRARCPQAFSDCLEKPVFTEAPPGHRVACFLPQAHAPASLTETV